MSLLPRAATPHAARSIADGADPPATPSGHVLAIGLIALLYLATVPFSIMHLDLARDIGRGLAITRGESLPLAGPVLASAIHVGPLWYYVLALPIAVWPAWLGVALYVGLLAALKFPLAYALGTRFADRRTGLLWALLLLYPGWMTFEAVLQNHASLVATCTLALMLSLHTFLRSGRKRDLAGAGLLFGVALHAHPSTIGLAPVMLAAIVFRQWRAARWSLADFLVAGSTAALPFGPYLAQQASAGFPDFARAMEFVGDPGSIGSVRNLGALLRATFVGGGEVVAGDLLMRIPRASQLLATITALVLISSAAGLIAALARGRSRSVIFVTAAATLTAALGVALVRAPTPYYMTFVVWALGAGLVAMGLRAAGEVAILRAIARVAIALAAASIVVTQVSVARTFQRGAYPLAFFPLFDVKTPYQRGEAMPFMPAHASGDSGRVLCSGGSVAAHGSYAVHLFHTYAIEARLACGRASHLTVGGAVADAHWTGLSRTIARELRVRATHRLGPITLVPAVRVVNPGVGAAVPDPSTYPPIAPAFGAPGRHLFEFEARHDDALVVTDAYFAFVAAPAVAATANGRAARLVARDHVSTAFVCHDCAYGETVKWELSVTTPAIERVDIVTVRMGESP